MAHMGAAEISAGGTKKFFQGWGLQKKDPGRETIFKT